MKKIFLAVTFCVLFIGNLFSQSEPYNLKNLNDVSVEIQDNANLLSSTISQKLLAEIKLHLISAGIKVVSSDASSAQLAIKIDYIRSAFAEQRVLAQFDIYEKVVTERVGKIETEAITYNDYSLFKAQNVSKEVYGVVMDKLLIRFINDYISQKEAK